MNLLWVLAAGSDQHVNGPVAGGGGILFVCIIIWLLIGSGPKNK